MGHAEVISWRWRRLVAPLAAAVVFLGALGVVRLPAGRAAPNQFVTVSDGVQIAVNVRLPDGYVPGRRYPTVFEMSGYDGGSAEDGTLARDLARATGVDDLPLQDDSRQLTRMFNGDYVTVHASVRGTGCSSGEFDLFSWRSALDGKELIDRWIAAQPWSNGDVAVMGHSYGGITGMMVAATRPDHLRAATVSGLVDDLYRGLLHPGGVANLGFPVVWGAGVRPAADVVGGLAPGLLRPEGPDDTPGRRLRCAASVAGKSRTVADEPVLHALSETDGPWFRARSLVNVVERVSVPTHVSGSHQDELTGPRGAAHLWERLRGVPRRLVLTNGDHAANQGPEVMADRKAWVDHWLLGADAGRGTLTERRSSVTTLLETRQGRAGAALHAHSFPYPGTRWTDWYLHPGGHLSPTPPAAGAHRTAYVAGAGPEGDAVTFRSAPMAADTAVVGPMAATVFAATSTPDTSLFVQVVDEAPDGSRSYLQRGLLKASHRALDPARGDRTPDGRVYRPHRPHTNPTPVTPGQVEEYLVEVFPVGHVFRSGHRLVVTVSSPPALDGAWAYAPTPPGVVAVHADALRPSRLLVPQVPVTAVALGPPPACGALDGVRCVAP